MQDEKLPPEQLESSLLCLDLADLLLVQLVTMCNVNNLGHFQPFSIRRWTRPGPIPDELEQGALVIRIYPNG